MTALVLGPLLRHVGDRTATVWVEADRPSEVRVFNEERGLDATARTFTVHGHHYALVEIDGLEPGSDTPYSVAIDGETVWPDDVTRFPQSRIRTLDPAGTLRISFGSCRRSPDKANQHGIDALAAYAHRLAEGDSDEHWPNVLLMVGDQVYADELSDEMRAFIRSRRDPKEPPVGELADFEDYTYLYKLAWHEDPAVRWLLSTVPTLTIFDDHDIRDDWNTSYTWRQQMWAQPWWRARITGGIGSYWIYQHLGNLSPQERASDPVYEAVRAASADGGDAGKILDEFAERADKDPASARWSYSHDLNGSRLIVVDSRCSRLLTEERRGMLDDGEFQWLDEQCQGDVDHLLIASSLPYLLPRAIHHAESWNEAMAEGAWGPRAARLGEKLRQGADLEHWAAFDTSFREVARDVVAVGNGERGKAPATISFLSGDIHYSYRARVTSPHTQSVISQIVCSPLRNPLVGTFRMANKFASLRITGAPFRLLAKLSKVPRPPLSWKRTEGPWFDNAICTVELKGRDCHVRWESPSSETTLTELGHTDIR
ncbi:alkaline phosphatase D family protein [Actinomadura rudentiformis]|uniref:Alkaline phosphatase family protein n=1 Tax=Actinomadura rudentiformis TaxID=359158 RepID=A0A6H9Z1X3_9ACTN|nr:alkaline phosphatase D family protein [Actinomadura rudentiformis]KAB2348548.1 alkaline phosphatase family protein [Actinomadura rudentiformis]